MKTSLGECGGLLVVLFLFIIVFSVIYQTLKQSLLFRGGPFVVVMVAFGVTTLCFVGIGGDFLGTPARHPDHQPVSSSDAPDPGRGVHSQILLIPYTALGLALLAGFVVISVGRLFQNPQRYNPNNKPDQNALQDRPHQHTDSFRPSEDSFMPGCGQEDGQDDDLPGRWVS
jgi:hypothetical protein